MSDPDQHRTSSRDGAPAQARVVGLGQPLRGDDALGWRVVDGLKQRGLGRFAFFSAGDPAEFLALLEPVESVLIIDAAAASAPVGTVYRFDVGNSPLPGLGWQASTHSFDLATLIELARALGRLPRRAWVYAIVAASFALGATLTPAVAGSVRAVEAELAAWLGG